MSRLSLRTDLFSPLVLACKCRRRYNTTIRRPMDKELRIIPVSNLGEISPGTDLGDVIYDALRAPELELQQGDILVVTQKIVSKAEGRLVNLNEVEPSTFAHIAAAQSKK